MSIKLKFVKSITAVPVKIKQTVKTQNGEVQIPPRFERKYDEAVARGVAKMCAECVKFLNGICEIPKKKIEVQPGQKPCRAYYLESQLCGATALEQKEAQEHSKEKRIHTYTHEDGPKPKTKWQEVLDHWFKDGKIPNPAYMNTKRWAYWESIKKVAGVLTGTKKGTVKIKVKIKLQPKKAMRRKT